MNFDNFDASSSYHVHFIRGLTKINLELILSIKSYDFVLSQNKYNMIYYDKLINLNNLIIILLGNCKKKNSERYIFFWVS